MLSPSSGKLPRSKSSLFATGSSSEELLPGNNSPRRRSMSDVRATQGDRIQTATQQVWNRARTDSRVPPLKLPQMDIRVPLQRLLVTARQIIAKAEQNKPPLKSGGSWRSLRIIKKDPLQTCVHRVHKLCRELIKQAGQAGFQDAQGACASFISEYDKDFITAVEKSEAAQFKQIQRLAAIARKVSAGIVFEQESLMIPKLPITEQVEYIDGPGLRGMRFESVPANDYSQLHGPHCDDMISACRFADGTSSIVCTDGEGSKAASDQFSHIFNASVQRQLLTFRPQLAKILSKSRRADAAALLEQLLGKAVDHALTEHFEQMQARQLDPSSQACQGASTLACAVSIADPKRPEFCWVLGINIYDSPVIVIEPDQGLITVHQQTRINSNVDTLNPDYHDYLKRTRPEALPHCFVSQHHTNALMLVMSDGVSDCLPLLPTELPTERPTERPQAEQNEHLAKALQAVVCNPYFDSYPKAAVKPNLTLEDLKKLGGRAWTPMAELSPKRIRLRLENYVTWRSSALRAGQAKVNPVVALRERAAILKETGLYARIFSQDKGLRVIFSLAALEQFAASLMREREELFDELEAEVLAHEELSEQEEVDFCKQFPAESDRTQFVILSEKKLDKLLLGWKEHLDQDKGAKTDGVSLVVARVIDKGEKPPRRK